MPTIRLLLAATLAAGVALQSAHAQDTGVTVRGVAYDSLRGTPMEGATITVTGMSQIATTDVKGRFAFSGVARGTHVFAMEHANLDSVGFSGVSTRVTVTDGLADVQMAVPSFATLWRAACGTSVPPRDSGFVYGSVRDARTGAPMPNVLLDLTWVDLAVNESLAMSQAHWREQARSDSLGSFAMCGVPPDVSLRIQAMTDSAESGLIDLLPSTVRVRRRDLTLGPADAGDAAAHGVISGVVTDTGGRPVAGARIITEAAPELRSAPDGRFLIRDVPVGTRQVEVLAIGMRPVVSVVDVAPNDTAVITAMLRKITTLDVVRVTASIRARRTIADYEERRRTGFGYAVDSTTIARHGRLSSVFFGFPGTKVERGRSASGDFSISFLSPGGERCVGILWVDGVPQRDYELLNTLHPDEVAAVEVYPHGGSVPMRFMRPATTCGAVVVWTKWAFS